MVCPACQQRLTPAPERVLAGGVRVVGAFEHSGAAKDLIHNLKYRAVVGYPDIVARELAPRIPRLPLVPVPRAWSRRLKYGIDPATVLARALGKWMDLPVLPLLRPQVHTPRRAGGDHSRSVPQFRARRPDGYRVILVDDVVTTGRTVRAAIESLGVTRVQMVVAANVVVAPSTLRHPEWEQEWPQY